MNTAERVVPHDLPLERLVLGAVLVHGELYPDVASRLRDTDFFRDAHQRMFRAMAALAERGVPIDYPLLRHELEKGGHLEKCGGPAYIIGLTDGVPRSVNVAHYCAVVKEKARLRELIFTANKVLGDAYAAEMAPNTIIDLSVSRLLAMGSTDESHARQIGAGVSEYLMQLDEPADSSLAMPTGFTDLDEVLDGGLRAEDLTVLAGRPSSGKTSLALDCALGLAHAGRGTVVFSLEQKAQQLESRALAHEARVDRHRLKKGFMKELEWQRLAEVQETLHKLPLWIVDDAETLTEIAAWVQRMKAEHNISAVVVDYLQFVKPAERHKDRHLEVASISKGLRRIARQQGVAMLVLSALNRAPEGRKDPRPRLSDMRESGTIESDADVALLLYRAEQYEPDGESLGIAEVIVAKNREGATGTVKLAFIADHGGKFENLASGS